ncbi:hypothetical protein AB0I72_06605 [Nocardiopsis sp. NPDC049922]|uniref:hypothetical protein n=1 Tax=Nocardiopsis sp. NPDC049922 TaxID=3155157 RepID=UPI0033CBA852
MRKHHTRWVALLGAATLSTTGLTGLAGPAVAADDKDPRVMNWPMVEQAVSSYKLDGFEIGYLPPGLDRFGINASSLLDRRGNSQSQISWVQGPDQLYGRVMVLRSEQVQKLEDLRELRYAHLPERGLERVEGSGDLQREAYVSESTGDMFWMVEPGVAVATHLRPERWDGDELRRMAESVVELTETDVEEETEGDAQEGDAEDGAGEAGEASETGEAEGSEETAEQDTETAEGVTAEVQESAESDEAAEQTSESDAFEVTEASIVAAPEEAAEEAEAAAEEAAEEAEEAAEEAAEEVEEAAEEAAEEAEESAEQDTGTAEGDTAEGVGAESELPEGAGARRVKQCLIDEFVVFEYDDTDREGTGRAPGEGVEQPLTRDQLTGRERDQLLATVWYHSTEDEKNAATDHCADSLAVERSEVESVLTQIADLIAQLVREAEENATEGMDEVTVTSETLAPGLGGVGGLDPMDDAEWEELWNSLPWAFEIETP